MVAGVEQPVCTLKVVVGMGSPSSESLPEALTFVPNAFSFCASGTLCEGSGVTWACYI